jgi:hypothetical protein
VHAVGRPGPTRSPDAPSDARRAATPYRTRR